MVEWTRSPRRTQGRSGPGRFKRKIEQGVLKKVELVSVHLDADPDPVQPDLKHSKRLRRDSTSSLSPTPRMWTTTMTRSVTEPVDPGFCPTLDRDEPTGRQGVVEDSLGALGGTPVARHPLVQPPTSGPRFGSLDIRERRGVRACQGGRGGGTRGARGARGRCKRS